MLGVYSMYWPSSLLGYEMRQELSKPQGGEWYVLLELSLPSGTARYHFKGFASAVQYDGLLIELAALIRTTPDRQSRIESVETECTVDDTANIFSAAVYGASGRSVRGSTAVLRLASPNVPIAGWFVAFSGVIDQYRMDEPNRWKVILRPDDLSLRRRYPKMVITAADWPAAPAASLAQYGPLVYGPHDASSTTRTGAIPCVYVDNAGFRYLLCWGRAKAVKRVFSDGVEQTSGWAVVYEIVNGRTCTLIDFVADQLTKTITADADGYEDVGDGTGVLIENPADQIKHELTNWVFGDYKSGPWLPTSSKIDTASFVAAAAFFDAFGHRGSRRVFLAEQTTGYDTINAWAQSWQAQVFWKHQGTISVAIFDFRRIGIYPDVQWVRSDRSPHKANFRPEWEGLVDRVNIDYLHLAAAGKYMRNLEVRDAASTLPDSPDSLQLPFSAAFGS